MLLVLGAYGGIATMCPWGFDEPEVVGRIALMQFASVLLLGMAIARQKSIERVHLAMLLSIAIFVSVSLSRFRFDV
jgi:hypothetical protein